MADHAVALQAQRLGEGDHVGRLCIEAVVQRLARFGQAAAAHIEHIGVELAAEVFADEAPGHGRAGDARHDDDRVARLAALARAAVAQVVLADAVGEDVGAVEKGGRHGCLRAAQYAPDSSVPPPGTTASRSSAFSIA